MPAPDADFQSGHLVFGPFLSEAMTEPNLQVLSPLNECLILVTLCGRSLLRDQQFQISKAYGDPLLDESDQRHWLDSNLSTRLQILSQCYPSPTEAYDPLLLFAHILGQATVIYFCKGMESETSRIDWREGSSEAVGCQSRALTAAATALQKTFGI